MAVSKKGEGAMNSVNFRMLVVGFIMGTSLVLVYIYKERYEKLLGEVMTAPLPVPDNNYSNQTDSHVCHQEDFYTPPPPVIIILVIIPSLPQEEGYGPSQKEGQDESIKGMWLPQYHQDNYYWY